MSEFKKGDKVLVEARIVSMTQDEDGNLIYMIMSDGDSARDVHPAIIVDKVHPIPTKTYEDGLREAWETAQRIMLFEKDGWLTLEEAHKIFGICNYPEIFKNFTASEAAAKIAEWEDTRKIRVGDVVKVSTNKNGYAVVSYVGEGSMCCVLWDDGSCGEHSKQDFVKTGRTIDIAGLLAQIGGADGV